MWDFLDFIDIMYNVGFVGSDYLIGDFDKEWGYFFGGVVILRNVIDYFDGIY